MLTVVSLLMTKWTDPMKTEGEHPFWQERGAEYAEKFFAGVDRNTPRGLRYALMTDSPELCPIGVEPVIIEQGDRWNRDPGWWSKLHLFKPGVFAGLTLYSDLDNVVYGPLQPLLDLQPNPLLMGRDGTYPDIPNGGIMLLYPERMPYVYENYKQQPEKTRKEFSVWPNASDQAYIAHQYHAYEHHPVPMLHDLLPGFFRDSRMQLEQGADMDGGSVVIGNYVPKPHESKCGWYKENWHV